MSELRKDPVVNRWVIIAPERGLRPRLAEPPPDDDFVSPTSCPFCEGNERMTPREVFAIRDAGEPDRPGWYVRVVPDKFPALQMEGELAPTEHGLFRRINGIGAHEVLIEHPRHDMDLALLPDDQIMRVLTAVRERVRELRGDPRFSHVVVFRNHGRAAGATLSHPHSQIVALPVVSGVMCEHLVAAAGYYADRGRCVYCDLLQQELAAGDRIIARSPHFVTLAPYASRFAYGTAVYPLRHCHDLALMTVEEHADLAGMLRQLLTAYRAALENPPYHLVYHTAPGPGGLHPVELDLTRLESCFHWHLEVMPRLMPLAGTEFEKGFFHNTVAPEAAADSLRKAMAQP